MNIRSLGWAGGGGTDAGRWKPLLLLGLGLLWVTIASAASDEPRRVALVIGNAAYDNAPLANPVNDAQAVARTLKDELGFDIVLTATNLDRLGFHRKVTEFRQSLKSGDIAVFYYSGHGVEVGGKNFLLPVKYDITFQQDVEVQAYSLQSIIDQMEAAQTALNVVILDACRDNPLPSATKSVGSKGLATPQGVEPGTLIAYATAPGRTAKDGSGENSPYTTVLLKKMREDGRSLPVAQLFNRIGFQVASATDRRQVPWVSSSPIPELTLAPGGIEPLPTAVYFSVENHLDISQVEESVDVFVGGRRAGKLTLSPESPAVSIDLSVPTEGNYPYRLVGSTAFRGDGGTSVVGASGSGTVLIERGSAFKVMQELRGKLRLQDLSKFRVRIRNTLGPGQVSERIELAIHDRVVAVLEIHESRPDVVAEFILGSEATYPYQLSGWLKKRTTDGEQILPLHGAGQIDIRADSDFSIQWVDDGGTGKTLALVKEPLTY